VLEGYKVLPNLAVRTMWTLVMNPAREAITTVAMKHAAHKVRQLNIRILHPAPGNRHPALGTRHPKPHPTPHTRHPAPA
jgi:hypothetical protein